jgi:hypothetical protein
MQPQYERLTDDQWEVIKHFLNWQRKRKLDLLQIMDAILFITLTGIQWRNHRETKFPDWQAVYYYLLNSTPPSHPHHLRLHPPIELPQCKRPVKYIFPGE